MKDEIEDILDNLCVGEDETIDYPKYQMDFPIEWQEGAKEQLILDILKAIKERMKHYER